MPTPMPPSAVASECLQVLESYGYARQSEHLRVVELSFEFDAVLVGPDADHALVLLVDQEVLDVDAVRRRLTSLALALSRSGSRRPVAVVLVAPPARNADLELLRPLARLVAVRRDRQTPERVAEALREFRPLDTDELVAPRLDATKELRDELGADADSPATRRLIAAASSGEAAVHQAFRELFLEALAGPSDAPASP